MERQIGEQFDYDGETLEVVESGSCKGCYFFKGVINCEGSIDFIEGYCGPFNRQDRKAVVFKKVE